ncbi:unnamed protein product [Adineta steineri]|uniref:TIL domain-containing protein n=1 Tax=Adineta steineri TaxID=433720 RepID=A0A814C7E4_9BILA|nr:unnamed protein product [Adineta steineri]CAF1059860.1 unnamed protein product [Adineta steineri]
MTCRYTILIFSIFTILVIVRSRYVNDITCSTDEIYNTCGTRCQRTCADRNKLPTECTYICTIGCFCIDGHVRKNDENSECIKETDC